MAHPIRPDSYQSIDNFYTRTVYDKGAEVIGMYKTILGPKGFRKGSDLYFDQHDGEAVTCEDFTKAMEDATKTDLSTFRNWYSQEGTPTLDVIGTYNKDAQTYTLTFKQVLKSGQKAFHIPVALGLVDQKGADLNLTTEHASFDAGTNVFHLKEMENTLTFQNIPHTPTPSLLRAFSAPVKLNFPYSDNELMHLIQHDSDGFNRWESGQVLGVRAIQALMEGNPNTLHTLAKAFKGTLNSVLKRDISPALAAEALALPPQSYLIELQEQTDLEALEHAYDEAKTHLANTLEPLFLEVYNMYHVKEAYSPTAKQIGQRTLKNTALRYLLYTKRHAALATKQFEESNNLTDMLSSLRGLVHTHKAEAQPALQAFYDKWHTDPMVLDSWFSVQASNPQEGTLKHLQQLITHEKFNFKRPNSVRALLSGVILEASGTKNFHTKAGYTWFTDQIIKLDSINPQVAARLVTPLISFKKYTPARQELMKTQLKRIIQSETLSKNMQEIVGKALA